MVNPCEKILVAALVLLAPAWAHAAMPGVGAARGGGGSYQPPSMRPKADSVVVGVGGFFFEDRAEQDGRELPGGRTILTHAHAQYNWSEYPVGLGAVYQLDKQGAAQTGTYLGLKGELYWGPYYLEAAYGMAKQTFAQRAVESREGLGSLIGVGMRTPLAWMLHFDLGIKRREIEYDQQDGKEMASPITRVEIVPFLGVGATL